MYMAGRVLAKSRVGNPHITLDIARDVRTDVLAPARGIIGDRVASVVVRTTARHAGHDVMVLAQVAQDYFRTRTALVVPGGVVVDAGANVGLYSVLVALAQPTAVVHAFEPVAACFEAAQANATVNGVVDRVNLNRQALGGGAANDHISLTFGGRQGTLSADILSDARTGATQVVSVVRLDDYCEGVGVERVDVLKLDVEGYEVNVLEGAPQTLAHTRVVVMEWHSPDRAERADHLLAQAGLTFLPPFSDALHTACGIGYWVRDTTGTRANGSVDDGRDELVP